MADSTAHRWVEPTVTLTAGHWVAPSVLRMAVQRVAHWALKKAAQSDLRTENRMVASKARYWVSRLAGLLGRHSAGLSAAPSAVSREQRKAGSWDRQLAVPLEHCLAARSVAMTADMKVARSV